MTKEEDLFEKLNEGISKESKAVRELIYLFNYLQSVEDKEEIELINSQTRVLKQSLNNINEDVKKSLEGISLMRPLHVKEEGYKEKEKELSPRKKYKSSKIWELTLLEREVIKRVKREEGRIIERRAKEPSAYISFSNRIFQETSRSLSEKKLFLPLKENLRRTNLEFPLISYLSVMLFTTLISAAMAGFIFLFILFFSMENFPAISIAKDIGMRALKFFWVLFLIPLGTFSFAYFYPFLERKSSENRINQELPFATIHMSAISGSMIEPSKIFSIVISSQEYPFLEKEFTKLINLINIHGFDLVTALRTIAVNNPSRKLADLLNSLATTITSGGDLPDFFEKRSHSLLFEYRLEREKSIKTSETFMDFYISIVIAAPMILMLLLIIMRVSGLGVSLSSTMIGVMMVLAVTIINIFFLTFLHLKQPKE